jgi:hypothetical protein
MNEKNELLPCPFCGAEAAIQEHEPHAHSVILKSMLPGLPDHPGSFTIECMGASCNTGQIADTREAVISMWNRRAARQALLAQPLQQEGGKEVDTDAAKRLRLIATKLGLGSAIPESDEDLWGCAFSVLGMIRRRVDGLLSQPSDKLQQASTAQAEPAKASELKCQYCGTCLVRVSAHWCQEGQDAKEAASATDAGQQATRIKLQSIDTEEFRKLVDAYHCATQEQLEEAYCAIVYHVDEDVAEQVRSQGILPATPAQATPEGGQDLPPLPWVKDGVPDYGNWYRETKDMGAAFRAYARAALASSQQAAEPVYRIRSPDAWPWTETNKEGYDEAKANGLDAEVLYRAAPPQQEPVAEFEGYEDGGRPLFRLLAGPLKVGEKLYRASQKGGE